MNIKVMITLLALAVCTAPLMAQDDTQSQRRARVEAEIKKRMKEQGITRKEAQEQVFAIVRKNQKQNDGQHNTRSDGDTTTTK